MVDGGSGLIAVGVLPGDMREIGELIGAGPEDTLSDWSGNGATIFKSVGLGVWAITKLVVDLAEKKAVWFKLDSYDNSNATVVQLQTE